jgi:hypothetical protein
VEASILYRTVLVTLVMITTAVPLLPGVAPKQGIVFQNVPALLKLGDGSVLKRKVQRSAHASLSMTKPTLFGNDDQDAPKAQWMQKLRFLLRQALILSGSLALAAVLVCKRRSSA